MEDYVKSFALNLAVYQYYLWLSVFRVSWAIRRAQLECQILSWVIPFASRTARIEIHDWCI